MNRFTRVLAWGFPPIPRGLVSRVQTPVVGAWGSASATGQAPASVTSTPAGAGQTTAAPASLGGGGRGPGTYTDRPGPDHRAARRSSDQLATDLIAWRTPS